MFTGLQCMMLFQLSEEYVIDIMKLSPSSNIAFSAELGLALVPSGWMMLAVLGVSHVFSPAQTEESGLIIVTILKMW